MHEGEREYFVYIMASHTKTLYVGVTNNLVRRVRQHQTGRGSQFSARYGIDRLAYYESTGDVMAAIEREKQVKSWRRAKKVTLIESINPMWRDLSYNWYNEGSDEDLGEDAPTPRLRSE